MIYRPGSFFVTPVTGWTGTLICVGEALAQTPSRYGHAGLITSEWGQTVEAAPRGAFSGYVSHYPQALVCDPIALLGVDEELRQVVVDDARALLGTPYSWLDYVALAALHLHLPSTWIRQRVASRKNMICSQLVDAVYQRAGIQLFAGRLPGDVMPADLANWAEDHRTAPV